MLLVTGLDMHTTCKPSNAPLPSETFEGLHVVYACLTHLQNASLNCDCVKSIHTSKHKKVALAIVMFFILVVS